MTNPRLTSQLTNRSTSFLSFCSFAMLLLLSACAPHTVSGALMLNANRDYESGRYNTATIAYEHLVATGVYDGVVFYNLGNAYYKTGDLGQAILNYRRAQRLLPRDPDVTTNLKLANAQIIDRLDTPLENSLISLTRRFLIESTTINESAALAVLLWVTLCILGTLWLLLKRKQVALRYCLVLVVIFFTLSTLSLGLHIHEYNQASAIVLADETEVRSGPGTDYLVQFKLHTGIEVQVIEQRGEWTRISLPGDLQGWLPTHIIEKI